MSTEHPVSTLTELFARDPLKLSEQDLDTIISELRKKRAQFALGEKGAGSMKPSKTAAKKAPLEKAGPSISLDELGL